MKQTVDELKSLVAMASVDRAKLLAKINDIDLKVVSVQASCRFHNASGE